MSILRSIIDSVMSSFSNEAFEQVQSRELRDQIMKAVEEASKDGSITVDEIADIKKLMDKLNIDESELQDIKIKLLKDLVAHTMKDNEIKPDERALLMELEGSLTDKMSELEKLKADMLKIKQL